MFNQIPLDGTLVNFNARRELYLSEVRASDTIEPPVVALKIGESIVGTLGNIVTLIGKAKSRKSFLVSIAVAVAISKDCVFGLIRSYLPNDKRVVLLFDTEQSKYHVHKSLVRICQMIGIKEPNNLKVFGLRKYSAEERIQLIEYAILNTENLGMVFIDGAKDICKDYMNPDYSNETVSKLMKWSEEQNICIVTVLHQNKGDNNARGHLGTELVNKSETVISVTKSETDKDISIVEAIACRNIDFDPFAFEINEFGIPVPAENFEIRTATKKERYDILDLEAYKKFQLLTEVYSKGTEFSYTLLQTQLQIAFKNQYNKDLAKNGVERLITDCKNNGWILQAQKLKPYTLGTYTSLLP